MCNINRLSWWRHEIQMYWQQVWMPKPMGAWWSKVCWYVVFWNRYSAFQKTLFLPFMKQKGVASNWNTVLLKVLPGSWSSSSKLIWIRCFKWGTVEHSMTIYSKVMAHQISWSKIISTFWSLPAKIVMFKWGSRSIPCLGELWKLLTLQSFNLKGSTVTH